MTETTAAIEAAFRDSYPLVVAGLSRQFRDIDLAEEAIQDAFADALRAWPHTGVPANPGGWLSVVSRRRAIDRLRREKSHAGRRQLAASLEGAEAEAPPEEAVDGAFGDERLEMMFACCHPSLAVDKQVALTLRTLGGLTTKEIADAFLVSEPTMAQRLVRAKAKIRHAGIPFAVPSALDLVGRLEAVLAVIYLIYNQGYLSSSGEKLTRHDLAQSAIELGRMVSELMPDQQECRGLLALMLLQHARRDARSDLLGDAVLLEHQDRSLWHADEIAEAVSLIADLDPPVGSYALQAAIAACHSDAHSWAETDWPRIVALYDKLLALTGSPVVALNRAVAIGERDGPRAGLSAMEGLDLDGYHLFHASRGELLRRAGDAEEARVELERAAVLTQNAAQKRLLEERLSVLG